jgi:hypothetical protein
MSSSLCARQQMSSSPCARQQMSSTQTVLVLVLYSGIHDCESFRALTEYRFPVQLVNASAPPSTSALSRLFSSPRLPPLIPRFPSHSCFVFNYHLQYIIVMTLRARHNGDLDYVHSIFNNSVSHFNAHEFRPLTNCHLLFVIHSCIVTKHYLFHNLCVCVRVHPICFLRCSNHLPERCLGSPRDIHLLAIPNSCKHTALPQRSSSSLKAHGRCVNPYFQFRSHLHMHACVRRLYQSA